ncbi:MAG: TRAP transporter fused permease subunit [Mariniblastus sp.]|nr:TRAP transporter fused permease subunit [Mariniblastus sp.]MDG2182866.1 TRAP transporter fused permease subunit [Mariniblastus sp.]
MTDRFASSKNFVYCVLAVVLSLFVLAAANFNLFDPQPNLAMFGMLGLLLVFLSRPLVKEKPDWRFGRAIDIGLMLLTVAVFGYIFVQSEQRLERFWVDGILLGDRAGNEKPFDFFIAGTGLVLILEATRRAIGWTLPILCSLFIAYAIFGASMPDWLFPHRGSSWGQIAQKSFLQSGGVFGVALKVMFNYVFLFVLFGTLLEQTGATAYVIKLARNLFKNSSGGPAKVAVVSSGLMGSLSGSAVANTATTGTFTIPLMKSSGFDSESAAGVEAAASSGGALMPPIMGAGAYMMLELVEPAVTYVEIIKAALIPAILYYTALLLTVHFHSKRIGADAESELEPESESPMSAYQGFVFFGAFVILIAMLLTGFTPYRSVSVSLIGILVLSQFSELTRLSFPKVIQALVGAAKGGMALIVAASCVGIILGVVDLTGLGASLPAKIQAFANDSAILALLLLMVSTIVLGMGLPSAVCYLLMAILVGSVLTTLKTPPLAAHLFIFYFGMMSMVTPPVALAAYAAAAIAKADVMKAAFSAFRFALVGFALPFAFVLKPELLMLTINNEAAPPGMIVMMVGITLVGILGLAASIAGFAFKSLSFPLRSVLLVLSLLVFFTRWQDWQIAVQLAAAGLILVLMAVNFSGARTART